VRSSDHFVKTHEYKSIMSTLDNFAVSKVKLGQLQINPKGAKQVPISLENDKSLFLQHGPLAPLFEPSAFNDPVATRVNLSLSVNDALEQELKALDDQVVKLLATDSLRLFGAEQTVAQIKDRMLPSMRVSDKGFKSWRMKMNNSGRNRVQVFDMDKNAIDPPENWVGCGINARVLVKSVWMMAKECGILYEAQAIQTQAVSVECPF
jgi:hypothetical protein